MGETIERLEDVRPGDLLITNIGGLVPGVFPVGAGQLACGERVRIGPFTADHVLVVTEASRLLPPDDAYPTGVITAPKGVQAMPRGAEEIELSYAKHWTRKCAYFRLPEDYPGQGLDAATIARAMIDTPYSFGSYVLLARWRFGVESAELEAKINRRRPAQPVELVRGRTMVELPEESICSVLGDQAWSLTGKRVVEGVAPQCVMPGKLAMQLWTRPGVVRGGPAILG